MHSKNYTLIILSVLLVVLVAPLFAQNSGYWTALETTQLTSRQVQPDIQPLKYKAFSLDQIKLDQLLGQAPERFSSYEEDEVIIELPMPDGSFQHFQVEYAPVMHPDLAARYPNIRTYVAYGIEDPQAYARLDYSPYGFHAQVFNHQKGSILVDPFSSVQTDYYISYYKKDYQSEIAFHCGTETVVNKITEAERLTSARAAGDCDLRKYRLALSCTGEYASFHGGTVSSTLAAMNTAMARVNGIYERDFGITMELIANNDELIFLNAGSDPFTNGSGGAMLGQNQSTIDDIIGTSNYDIGHVFSTGGGGIAGLGVVCSSSRKAQGVTGLSSPINDPFYVDYVAHEIGHQFGGNHTQNNRCNSVSSTSMEPGSASTIMGYAGICAPNVQFNSDDYFHAISIQEIVNYSNSDQGDSCPEKISTGNNLPTVDAGSDYIIPISTPFALTANGDDEDGDALTYCWEQMDPQEASMPPSSSSSAGPLFRSYSPVASPTRYFPRLPDLINNFDSDWEELPGVNRTMNFRCTVRDNHLGNGCTAEDDLVLTVIASAG
ncbi:MAG: reprolysin-like metallopeptidase, partial [Bacteroidota bacterium]